MLVLVRLAPGFASIGPRASLFAWLGYVTLVTALVPSAILLAAMRVPPRELGLGWGDTRRDAALLAIGVALAAGAAVALSRVPELRAYYPHARFVKEAPWWWIPTTAGFAAWGLAWEALFRGFLLLGLRSSLGWPALLVQAAFFTLAHLDKPRLELWLSAPAGLAFGLVAWRTRSVLPGFLLHFTLSTTLNVLCAYG